MEYKYLIRKLGFSFEIINPKYNSENVFGEFDMVLNSLLKELNGFN
jgi:hypothetical protein